MKRDTNRPAFSLIELLVVILIIALVVAILLPALGHVRAKSRDSATRNLLQNLSQSIAAFELENKRLPGYWAERDLGAPMNGQGQRAGLTSLDNALFELCGGLEPTRTAAAPGYTQVGPTTTTAQQVWFNPDLVGKVGYFTPPPQYYKPLDGADNGEKVCAVGATGNPNTGNYAIKGLVDAEGMPIIAWMADKSAVGPINTNADVAAVGSSATTNARFYMNSNHAILAAPRIGKKLVNQNDNSMIGFGGTTTNNVLSLAAMLGAPGTAKDTTQPVLNMVPTATRGSFVLHSAGRNGVFMGKEERGAARAANIPTGNLYYGLNFKDYPNTVLTDDQGRETSTDIMKDFDDIIVPGGG